MLQCKELIIILFNFILTILFTELIYPQGEEDVPAQVDDETHSYIDSAVSDDVQMDKVLKQSEVLAVQDDETTEEDIEHAEIQPKKKTANTKQMWTKEEEEEIKQKFKRYFLKKERPSPSYCAKVILQSQKENGLLGHRKKDVLKKKVFRMIDGLKT